eukprot:2241679-Rhodomonas_salina.1
MPVLQLRDPPSLARICNRRLYCVLRLKKTMVFSSAPSNANGSYAPCWYSTPVRATFRRYRGRDDRNN